MDDCLRCHGMHFDGGIRDLVTPIVRRARGSFTTRLLAARPCHHCLTCHQMHHQGVPLARPAGNP